MAAAEEDIAAVTVETVRSKLVSGEWYVRNKEGTKKHPVVSKLWAGGPGNGTFRVMSETGTDRELPWVQCKVCLMIEPHSKNSSTNKLNRHSKKCSTTCQPPTQGILDKAGPSNPTPKQSFVEATVDFVCSSGVAFNALSGPHFEQLIDAAMLIARQNPGFTTKDIIPHPTTIARNVKLSADRARLEIMPDIRESINSGEASAATDMYTNDMTKISYLALSIHFVAKVTKKKARITLFCNKFVGSHTAHNIEEALLLEFASLGIEEKSVKKIYFTTDNGSNIKLALQGYNRMHFMAHAINLILKNSFVIKIFDLNVWGEIGTVLDEIVQFICSGKAGHKIYALTLKNLIPPKTKIHYRSKIPLYTRMKRTFNQVRQ